MATEIEEFREFIDEQLDNGGKDLTPEEILDLWRVNHPTPDELKASVADLDEAIAEMDSGVAGTPAREVSQDIRNSLNLPRDT